MRNQELELNERRVERIGELQNAVYDVCVVFTENPDLEWDMSYIGEITDRIADILTKQGKRVRYPAIVSDGIFRNIGRNNAMSAMTLNQAMQWIQNHREKGAYEDLTDAIRQALADDDDEKLGKYVIESFEKAREGAISPEQAAQDMFTALVGWDLEFLVQHIAENEEWS